MNFIQQQLQKQQNKGNKGNKFHNSKKPPTKLPKPTNNIKPMRAK